MTKHEFSPIITNERLEAALVFVADNAVRLAKAVLGRDLPLDTVCFFAQTPEEHAFLEKAVLARGPKSQLSHGATFYADTDFMAGSYRIRIFGVRAPDPTRPWVGYGDYPVDDYAALKAAEKDNPYVREIISGCGRPLLELRQLEFDVLGFVVDQTDHK